MTADGLEGFLADQQLPPGFQRTIDLVCLPLADAAVALHARLGRMAVIGLCGAQGSGKSTIAGAVAHLIAARGLRAVVLSLDDLYLTRAERRRLAAEIHPLLAVRGPPGTHDLELGFDTICRLAIPAPVAMPRFDKAADDVLDSETFNGPADVVIFEGWCVGARPEPPMALRTPRNDLEREQDLTGVWRTFVNDALTGPYQRLFGWLDALVMLQAPGFEVVARWRGEQEAKLRARTGRGMAAADIARFVAHYERVTRHILKEMPGRADWVVPLDEDRTPRPQTPCQL